MFIRLYIYIEPTYSNFQVYFISVCVCVCVCVCVRLIYKQNKNYTYK